MSETFLQKIKRIFPPHLQAFLKIKLWFACLPASKIFKYVRSFKITVSSMHLQPEMDFFSSLRAHKPIDSGIELEFGD